MMHLNFYFLKFFGLLTFCLLLLSACESKNEEELFPEDLSGCDTLSVSYQLQILPLFESQCFPSCHEALAQLGGFNMEVFTEVQSRAKSGLIFEVLNLPRGNPRAMPLGGNFLPQCDLLRIKAWAEQGALNN